MSSESDDDFSFQDAHEGSDINPLEEIKSYKLPALPLHDPLPSQKKLSTRIHSLESFDSEENDEISNATPFSRSELKGYPSRKELDQGNTRPMIKSREVLSGGNGSLVSTLFPSFAEESDEGNYPDDFDNKSDNTGIQLDTVQEEKDSKGETGSSKSGFSLFSYFTSPRSQTSSNSQVKTRASSIFERKRKSSLADLHLAQQLKLHAGPVWCVAFSTDGRYLATGGKDGRLVVWSIAIDRRGVSDQDILVRRPIPQGLAGQASPDPNPTPSVPYYNHTSEFDLLHETPCRIFKESDEDIVEISWTKKHFLVSASADNAECLLRIEHPDILTSVQFHPQRDNLIVTGCLDGVVRLWDLFHPASVKSDVPASSEVIVTSVCYSPDGTYVVAGRMDGSVFIYLDEAGDLKYYTQIACIRKNKRMKSGLSRKVCGIAFISRGDAVENTQRRGVPTKDLYNLLVTTNDNTIRLIGMSDFTVIVKFKGLENTSRQIRAVGSSDGKTVICGSDTGSVFIWQVPNQSEDFYIQDKDKEKNGSYVKKLYQPKRQQTCWVADVILPRPRQPSSSGNKEVTQVCTCASYVPLSAIHLVHQASAPLVPGSLDHPTTTTTTTTGSIYTREDEIAIAILTTEYDGTINVLYKAGEDLPPQDYS